MQNVICYVLHISEWDKKNVVCLYMLKREEDDERIDAISCLFVKANVHCATFAQVFVFIFDEGRNFV